MELTEDEKQQLNDLDLDLDIELDDDDKKKFDPTNPSSFDL